MRQKINGDTIYVKADKEEAAVINSWRLMTYDKENGWWYGDISRQLLEKLKQYGGLIPAAEKWLEKLQEIQAAVDAERTKPDRKVRALYKYPVKAKLLVHQVRAANMAAYIFGVADPGGER